MSSSACNVCVILTTPVMRVLTWGCSSGLSRGAEGPGLASSIRGMSSGAGGTATRPGAGLALSGFGAGARKRWASPLLGTDAVGAGGAGGLEFALGTLMLRLRAGGTTLEAPACGWRLGTASPGAWLPRMIRWPASGGPSLSGAAAISTAGGITGITWGAWGAWTGAWAGAWANGCGSIWMRLPCMWLSDMGCSGSCGLSCSCGWVIRAEAWMFGCCGRTTSFTSFNWIRRGCRFAVPLDWCCVDVPGWGWVRVWDCDWGCADEVLAWGLSCVWVLVLAFSWVFVEALDAVTENAREKFVVLVEVLGWGPTTTSAEEPACGCASPDVHGWGWTSTRVGALDVTPLDLAFVEVDGVWIEETAWSSTFVCADVPSCCCEFVLSFGWDSVNDEEPGCGCVSPDVLDCSGICVRVAGLTAEELALASLEVEGAEPGSPVGTPEVELLWPKTWIMLWEAPLHFAAGRITCLRAGVRGWRKRQKTKMLTDKLPDERKQWCRFCCKFFSSTRQLSNETPLLLVQTFIFWAESNREDSNIHDAVIYTIKIYQLPPVCWCRHHLHHPGLEQDCQVPESQAPHQSHQKWWWV